MYQVYFFFGPGNKWTEGFNSYEEAVTRIVEMKDDLETRTSFTISIIGPDGTQIQKVSK